MRLIFTINIAFNMLRVVRQISFLDEAITSKWLAKSLNGGFYNCLKRWLLAKQLIVILTVTFIYLKKYQ